MLCVGGAPPHAALLLPEGVDAEQRLRPHSSLIRQSSWSGLSQSSSHESLTGALVKSSSLSSMNTPTHSKLRLHPALLRGSAPQALSSLQR